MHNQINLSNFVIQLQRIKPFKKVKNKRTAITKKMQKLSEIAKITTGVYAKPQPSGDTFYLQAKHFDRLGGFKADTALTPELSNERLQKHLLQSGDILLIAKGSNNIACLYPAKLKKAVASSIFFVIRLETDDLQPKFLQWYLNTPQMQHTLAGLSKGTHIPSISKKLLSQVEIPTPTVAQQTKILQAYDCWQNEKNKTLELLQLKETLYQNSFLQIIKTT